MAFDYGRIYWGSMSAIPNPMVYIDRRRGWVWVALLVALSSEVEWSQRFMTFTTFFKIGLLLTPRGFQNATKYECAWIQPHKIIDHGTTCALAYHHDDKCCVFIADSGIDARLLWSVCYPHSKSKLINMPQKWKDTGANSCFCSPAYLCLGI